MIGRGDVNRRRAESLTEGRSIHSGGPFCVGNKRSIGSSSGKVDRTIGQVVEFE